MQITLAVEDVDRSLGYRLLPMPLDAGIERYFSGLLILSRNIREATQQYVVRCGLRAHRKCSRAIARLDSLGVRLDFAFDNLVLRRRRARATAVTFRNRRGLIRAGRFSPPQRGRRIGLSYANSSIRRPDQHGSQARRLKSAAVTLALGASMAVFSTPVYATSLQAYAASWINHDFIPYHCAQTAAASSRCAGRRPPFPQKLASSFNA